MRTLAAETALTGLRSIELLIEGASDAAVPGIDPANVRWVAERALASIPIRLLPPSSGGAILCLNLDVVPGCGRDLVAGVELQILENVWPARDPGTRVLAATWDEGAVLACHPGDSAYVTSIVSSLVGRFVTAWLRANAH